MKNIKHLLNVVDKVRDHVALGLMSDPGLSKTAQVKQWAEENERAYCELVISQRMPSEISGMPMPIPDKQRMEVFDFETLLKLKDGDVLAFDEFTNGNIQTLNACLTLIQERTMLSGKKLPSLLIVAMGNPQGKCELLPQTKQRFWWVNIYFDGSTWRKYMKDTWGIFVTPELIEIIGRQYQIGFSKVHDYNYDTPRTIENLIRIALNIPEDDPFWEAAEVPEATRREIYKSINSTDTFAVITKQIIDWVGDRESVGKEGRSSEKINLLFELGECNNISELRDLIKRLEAKPGFEDLITYLKTGGEKVGEQSI